jgi:hypothetical protein
MVNECKKKCYVSKKEAKKALKAINKKKRFENKMTNSYFCIPCNAFHLTSMPKESSRNYTRHLNKLYNESSKT